VITSVPPLELHCGFLCGAGPVGKLLELEAKHEAINDADAVLQAFATWVLAGAVWLLTQVITFLKQSTAIDIGTWWFERREEAMADVALFLVLPMVLAATIGAIIRQDPKRLVRIYAVGIPLAGTATIVALALVSEAVAVVDAMCTAITSGHNVYRPITNIDGDMGKHTVPVVVAILVAGVVVVAGMMLWLELILRSVIVDITVFFLPLALAAIVWPATAQIAKRFIEVLVAVIGSKFVIVATLTLANAMAFHVGATVADAVKACAVLLLAAFAPVALLRLVPLVEVAAIAHMEGMSRRAIRAGAGATASVAGGTKGAAGLLLNRAGSDVEGGSVGAVDLPWRESDFDIDDLPGDGGGSGGGGDNSILSGSIAGASGPPGGGGSPGGESSGGGLGADGFRSTSDEGRGGTAVTDRPREPDHAEPWSGGSSTSARPWADDADLPDPSDLPGPLPILGSPPAVPPDRSGGEDG
jgi:hypothetical protein